MASINCASILLNFAAIISEFTTSLLQVWGREILGLDFLIANFGAEIISFSCAVITLFKRDLDILEIYLVGETNEMDSDFGHETK